MRSESHTGFAVAARNHTFTLALLMVASQQQIFAQVSPEDSAKKLKPADGLEATLWASEPLVVNPTNIDIDSRGRVWVTEGLNYRLTRGGNRQFQKIDGADKIKILEDTNGDGRADKMTVFAENVFPVPMGIAVEEQWSKAGKYEGAKVYIGNSPDLLVLEDTDGDDVADKRYPLLTGFGGIDSDHGVHGMTLGPDGKLYFTHGDGCCSVQQDKSERTQNFDVVDKSGRRVKSDQLGSVLRCNRDGTHLELLATRLRNDYECAVDSFGNVFASDNDDDGNRGSRVVWIMDGGTYGYRTSGSRLHWGEDVPGNIPKLAGTGNGSPCGVMVYEGDALPPLYRGALLEAEAGPRVINAFPLKRVGAGFRTEQHIMLSSDDDWFRPVDVCAAPDGSVFVADWYDGGVGGHAFRDQSTGRIYRVSRTGDASKRVPYDFSTTHTLVEALKSPNIATRDVARRLLAAPRDLPITQEEFARLVHGRTSESPNIAARYVWIDSSIEDELDNNQPAIREQAVRVLGRDNSRLGLETSGDVALAPPAAMAELEDLIGQIDDRDAGVRRELILAFRDIDTAHVGDALRTLAAAWDGQDRWYLEALGLALRQREPEFVKALFDGGLYGDLSLEHSGADGQVALPPYFPVDRNEAYLRPGDTLPPANALSKTLGLMWALHRTESLPLLSKLLPTLKNASLLQAADDIIAQVEDAAGAPIIADMILQLNESGRKTQAMASLARKLEGSWRAAAGSEKVVELIESSLAEPTLRDAGISLAGATHDGRYAASLFNFAKDEEVSSSTRVAALEALARLGVPELRGIATQLIVKAANSRKSSPVAEAAMRALVQSGESGEQLGSYMTGAVWPLPLRREALRGLAQRRPEVDKLLAWARDGSLPNDLRLEAATVLRAHPDRDVRDKALEVFPIRTKEGKPLPSTGELMRREGDAERGKLVFFANEADTSGTKTACASCHRVRGDGRWIGPDLSTIGVKYGKQELLNSILNPSAAIGFSFRSQVVATHDGRLLTGLVVDETPQNLVLKTAEGQRITIEKSTIDERRDADLSLMPEGLVESLDEQELVDLLAYLVTLNQPVSVVGELMAAGPFEDTGKPGDTNEAVRPDKPAPGAGGKTHDWRKVIANAEGVLNLEGGPGSYLLHVPISSEVKQPAHLVIGSAVVDAVWLNGKLLSGGDRTLTLDLNLPAGTSDLNVRVLTKPDEATELVLTIVSDQPVAFSGVGAGGRAP